MAIYIKYLVHQFVFLLLLKSEYCRIFKLYKINKLNCDDNMHFINSILRLPITKKYIQCLILIEDIFLGFKMSQMLKPTIEHSLLIPNDSQNHYFTIHNLSQLVAISINGVHIFGRFNRDNNNIQHFSKRAI